MDSKSKSKTKSEQQSDAEAKWNSTTRDSKLKRRRECTQAALNYLCAKSYNDIDLKANVRASWSISNGGWTKTQGSSCQSTLAISTTDVTSHHQ
jgi:hypothetical protein